MIYCLKINDSHVIIITEYNNLMGLHLIIKIIFYFSSLFDALLSPSVSRYGSSKEVTVNVCLLSYILV